MGLLLGVAKGSEEEPRLIHLIHEPEGASKKGPLLTLVGKGITFDSGGLSLKDTENMLPMIATGSPTRTMPRSRIGGPPPLRASGSARWPRHAAPRNSARLLLSWTSCETRPARLADNCSRFCSSMRLIRSTLPLRL